MKIRLLFGVLVFLPLFMAGDAHAHTLGLEKYRCPLCDNEFEGVMAYSGTSYGQRLDFKQVGPIYSPSPIPQCPECRYVFASRPEKFQPGDKERIKAYLASDAFRNIPEDAPPYFYLARIQEHLGAPAERLVNLYLLASWQAEGTEALDDSRVKVGLVYNPEMIDSALAETLRCLDLIEPDEAGDFWKRFNHSALRVEANRRLGHFERAAVALDDLRRQMES